MPRLSVPEGQDPLINVWAAQAPDLTVPAAQLSAAVYEHSTLPIREFESARITIARINDCQLCLGWRSARDTPSRAGEADDIDEAFYDKVRERDFDGLTEREQLAAEFAELFATDHLAMDDAFWARLRAAFTDAEIVELGISVGMWVSQGRLNQVLDVDGGCRVPIPGAPLTGG
jgi:alkylhydroperoxidase family enzyme